MPAPRFHGWIVAIAAAGVLLVRLGGPALWDDDEPKNAACSLAMLESGDWVVPTFNGRLRVEKPPLVNWLQMAGFTACGRNETGARIGAAVLTIGTCLVTWRTGVLLLGPSAGLVGGLAMATCVWTAVGGRAATPDAPLVFFTTLALFLYARGTRTGPGADGCCRAGEPARLSARSAIGIGAACGAAALAKGPIGIALPLAAFLLHAAWRRGTPAAGAAWRSACGRIRAPTILLTAVMVAAPWYAAVAARTEGGWLRGFLVDHNLIRFASAMEGHSGSVLYYPAVVAIGLFPWSIVLAATAVHVAKSVGSAAADGRGEAIRLITCWAAAWIGILSCAATKLPGYVWPAYPALALATGLTLGDWADGKARFCWPRFLRLATRRGTDRRAEAPDSASVMRLAWCILGATGLGFAVTAWVAARRYAPGGEWVGMFGLVPLAAAVAAWRGQTAGRPWRSIGAVAVGGCLFVALCASFAAESFSRAQGARELVARLGRPARDFRWACLWNVPPSLVFYTNARIERLGSAAEVAGHLARFPEARVVIDGRQRQLVSAALPAGCGVLARVPTVTGRDYLLLGRTAPGGVVDAAPLALHAVFD